MLNGMVPIPEAVKKAKEFVHSMFELPADLIRLEEIDSGDTGGQPAWLITLSVPAPTTSVSSVFATPGRWQDRDYKTLSLSKETGEVLAVKIREFAALNG